MKILKMAGKGVALVLGGLALIAAGKSSFGEKLFSGGKDDADAPLNEDEFSDDIVEATAEETEEVPAEEAEEAVEPEPEEG